MEPIKNIYHELATVGGKEGLGAIKNLNEESQDNQKEDRKCAINC
jgi:hypothetical protein